MNSRNILNFGLALVLAGLIALVIYEPGKEVPVQIVKLTKLDPDDIHHVVIQQKLKPSIILKKIDNQWQMEKPFLHRANTLLINQFLAISHAKSHVKYSSDKVNLKQFELSTPKLTVSLNNTILNFGTTDALNGYRYTQINDMVHLITDRFSHLVRGNATSLLSPALLPEHTVISKLVLPELTLQTNETGWQINPDHKSASADTIHQLLDEWRFARALRISNITGNTRDIDSSTIEIHTTKHQTLLFKLTRTEDEIILLRADIGLSYHFDKESGKRLLKLQSAPSQSLNSN